MADDTNKITGAYPNRDYPGQVPPRIVGRLRRAAKKAGRAPQVTGSPFPTSGGNRPSSTTQPWAMTTGYGGTDTNLTAPKESDK